MAIATMFFLTTTIICAEGWALTILLLKIRNCYINRLTNNNPSQEEMRDCTEIVLMRLLKRLFKKKGRLF